MTTKTFTTYGKRSRRTVFAPLVAAQEPQVERPENASAHSTPTLREEPAIPGDIDNNALRLHESPLKTTRAGSQSGLNRRKPHQHLVTPGKRGASMVPLASASRSVVGHKRLRALPSPTKGRQRFEAPDYPAKSSRIPDRPSPLREADINRIHLTRINNDTATADRPGFPDINDGINTKPDPRQKPLSVGTKHDPIDLSEDNGTLDRLASTFPSTRKSTGSKKQPKPARVRRAQPRSGPVSKVVREAGRQRDRTPASSGSHDVQIRDHVTPRHSVHRTTFAENRTVSDEASSVLHHFRGSRKSELQIVPPIQSTPSLEHLPSEFTIGVATDRPQRYGLPTLPPSPDSTGSRTINESQISTPRRPTHGTYIPQNRLGPFSRPSAALGSSPFPGKRRDSPFLWRGAGPSAPSFDDLITSFSDLSFSISISATATPISESPRAPVHVLDEILKACHQDEPTDFEAFISTFPARYYEDVQPYRKVGEASYSEVFALGDIVLKVVPLLSEHQFGHLLEDTPPETPIEDALREILFISRMGSLQGGSGFSALLGAHVVQGRYPPVLLAEWDKWDAKRGSESIRPGCFMDSQLYAIIEMAYSGEDLETYRFPRRSAWQQAACVFWQVATSLERAERYLQFEHRDLHWGQVLLLPSPPSPSKATASMEDPGNGVAVTIIDFGFSRMDAPNPDEPPLYTPFEPEVFEGEGDYQYDIYRMMRNHNHDEWATYRPITNLMWLHYLSVKLLKHKGLKRPLPAKAKAAALADREMLCYDSLCQAEALLRKVVEPFMQPQSMARQRRQGRGINLECAGDLCAWARDQQWIK